MKVISISAVISQAWELTKKAWAPILGGIIIVAIVQYVINQLCGPDKSAMAAVMEEYQRTHDYFAYLRNLSELNNGSQFLSGLINLILTVGIYNMALHCAKGDTEFSLKHWQLPIMTYVKIIVASIISYFIIGFGVILCVLPGLYLAARLQFVTLYYIEHPEAGWMEGIQASWNMTSENGFTLFGLLFVYFGIGIIGLLCCCIGIFVSMIVIYFGAVVSYLMLCPEDNEPKAEVTE